MPILTTSDLSLGYRQPRQPEFIVASQLNLVLRQGELVCLLGPNGAGKSTLMRTLVGMQPPLGGTVKLDDREIRSLSVSELARSLSIVLTERVDAGNLSTYELVSLGRHPYTDWMGRLSAADHDIVRWAIEVTTAGSLRDRPVNQLSDGERQKVMIARALAQEPTIMLLDEPTAYLDLPRRVEIINMLRNLAQESNCAILLSTHDLDLALRNADRIWLLSNSGVMHIGTPEELVLNGAFAAVFRSEGLEFDSSQGTFKVQRVSRGTIGLLGEGESTFWTERALERIGFEVVRDDHRQPVQVLVLSQNSTTRWKTINQKGDSEHPSLSELIQYLQ